MTLGFRMGKLHQINIGSGGVPKQRVCVAEVTVERVLGDDWNWSHEKIQPNGKLGKHGGKTQAVCLYSLECLEKLKASGLEVFPGALGENFTTEGIDYHSVRIQDIYRVGPEVQICITKIRSPCLTIVKAYGQDILSAMCDERVKQCDYSSPKWGMTGFYAEVLQPGFVREGDNIVKIN